MLVDISATPAFGWRTNYELQVFRGGHWTISSVFDDRDRALIEARRLDRTGKMVRLREDSTDKAGKGRGLRTIYISATIKNNWREERSKIATRGTRARSGGFAADTLDPSPKPINPYYLASIFFLVVFLGLGAIFALRSLYALV